jgi:hypothetical protein
MIYNLTFTEGRKKFGSTLPKVEKIWLNFTEGRKKFGSTFPKG